MLTFIDMTASQWGQTTQQVAPHSLTQRDLLDAIGALRVEVDTGGLIQSVNGVYTQLTGHTIDDLQGQDVCTLFTNESEREALTQGFGQLKAGKVDHIPLHVHWRVGSDKRPRLVEGACIAEYDVHGQVESFVLVGIDVTEHHTLERDMATLNASERRKVGESLHEKLGMDLAAAAMKLQNLQVDLEAGESCTAEDLESITKLVRDGAEQARTLSHMLTPVSLQQNRFGEALDDLAREEDEKFSGTCTFFTYPSTPQVSDHTVATHLYRIAREAVINARTHANPNRIVIRLSQDNDALLLSIHNDGSDWDPDALPSETGQGLARMQYRAHLIGGTVRISHGHGNTMVVCRVPIDHLSNTERATCQS